MTVPASPSQPPAALEAVQPCGVCGKPIEECSLSSCPAGFHHADSITEQDDVHEAVPSSPMESELSEWLVGVEVVDGDSYIVSRSWLRELISADLLRAASKPTPLTLAELEALPVKSGVLEVNTEDIWQKFIGSNGVTKWCFDGIEWTSEGLLNDCGPVVLLFRPEGEQS